MLYFRLIYMLSILCVRLTIKVKVGIPESFKVGWYPHKITGSSHLKSHWTLYKFWLVHQFLRFLWGTTSSSIKRLQLFDLFELGHASSPSGSLVFRQLLHTNISRSNGGLFQRFFILTKSATDLTTIATLLNSEKTVVDKAPVTPVLCGFN